MSTYFRYFPCFYKVLRKVVNSLKNITKWCILEHFQHFQKCVENCLFQCIDNTFIIFQHNFCSGWFSQIGSPCKYVECLKIWIVLIIIVITYYCHGTCSFEKPAAVKNFFFAPRIHCFSSNYQGWKGELTAATLNSETFH